MVVEMERNDFLEGTLKEGNAKGSELRYFFEGE
jgi:hypothetical protein